MSGGVAGRRPRASVPAIGLWMPTAALHLGFLLLAAALCLLVLPPPGWLTIGLLFAMAATLRSNLVPTWWLLLLLGLSQVWREPSATDPVFYVLLGGVHLLHVLGGLARVTPWNGRVQLRALTRPLRRFVIVQAVTQALAVGTLLVFDNEPVRIPGLSILAAMVLGLLAAVLARRPRASPTDGLFGHHSFEQADLS